MFRLTEEVFLPGQVKQDTPPIFHDVVPYITPTLFIKLENEKHYHRSLFFDRNPPGLHVHLQTRQPEPLHPLECGVWP